MSKAFTNEDSASAELVTRPPPQLAPGEKRYITPEGARAMRQAVERLMAERAEVQRAPAEFDTPAKLAEIDRRIATINATLATLTVVEPDPARSDRVFFGAWVTLEDEDGERVTYRIVGPDEADAKAGLVSVESPIAKALLGKEPGDAVTVRRPKGPIEYEITDVRYTEPNAG